MNLLLRNKLIGVYNEVRRICEENDIRYFAGYGTAIGAVRHKGIIPWDDDIDIEMPWDDYLKFIDIAPSKLSKKFKLSNGMNFGESFIFCKVFDINTTFFVSHIIDKPDTYTGVYVDIFPITGAPSGEKAQRRYEKSMSDIYDRLWQARILGSGEDEKKLIDRYIELSSKYDFNTSKFVRGGYTPKNISPDSIYPKEHYDGYIEVSFEDTTTRVPVGYDKVLTALYGDYMSLPPLDKREAHLDDSILDLDNTYIHYAKLQSNKDAVASNFINFSRAYIARMHRTLDYKNRVIWSLHDQYKTEIREKDARLDKVSTALDSMEKRVYRYKSELNNLNSIKASASLLSRNLRNRISRTIKRRRV